MKRNRIPSKLNDATTRWLNAYALAAGAAGVSALALAPPAEARIVYTKTHLNCSSSCSLDLEHGKRSFQLTFGTSHTGTGTSHSRWEEWLSVYQRSSSTGVKNALVESNGNVAALKAGVRVATATAPGGTMWFEKGIGHSATEFRGNWVNDGKGVTDRYLGLKFYIKGKAHFGWARLTTARTQHGSPYLHTTLSGYAYETVPNEPIITGKTKGPDVITVQDATLGHLAAGASAMPPWRAKR